MAYKMEQKLGDLLVVDQVISRNQLDEALGIQKTKKESIGRILMDMGATTEWEIAAALGKQLNVPFITLSQYEIEREVLDSIPRDIVLKYNIVPVDRTGDTLTVALPDPNNIFILDELRLLTRCNIVPVISFETDIEQAIERYFSEENNSNQLEEMMTEMSDDADMEIVQSADDDDEMSISVDDAPVIKLVNAVVTSAIREGASDIHIEPYEKVLRLRYRIDGVLQNRPSPPKKFQNAIISRIKILSEMDIAEKRLPQDGRFKIRLDGKDVDFRVNACPVSHGEKVVIRILAQTNLMELKGLGFEQQELTLFKDQISKPWGMILVTGPTGSGKSTTLYSALTTINTADKNISTIEDPVEYQLHGINQVAMRDDIGLTFAEGLRAFLRQDPDIIMVGEIRDKETSEVAVKAALTGHLVLSTLHTNDAPSTVNRLTNMGVEAFLVTASLNLIVAQRLVRRICGDCKESYSPSAELEVMLGAASGAQYSRGEGCSSCKDTGYRGRVALYELMELTDEMREHIISGISSSGLKRLAIKSGMRTLRQSGIVKTGQGITTPEEVLTSTVSDDQ